MICGNFEKQYRIILKSGSTELCQKSVAKIPTNFYLCNLWFDRIEFKFWYSKNVKEPLFSKYMYIGIYYLVYIW